MGFSRQEYWSRLTIPSPEDLPAPGMEPEAPALAEGFFTTEPPGKPQLAHRAGLWCGGGSSGESSCFFRAESSFPDWWCGLAWQLLCMQGCARCVGTSCHIILFSGSALSAICCHYSAGSGFPGLLGRSAPLCTLGSSLQGSFTVEGCAVGGSPGNTSPGDGSHIDCHGRGALEPQHVPFFWSWSKAGLPLSASSISPLPSAFCHAEVCWNLLAFDAPSHFLYSYGTVLSPCFVIPLASF